MKTENEINLDILNITMTIRDKYPELMKYLAEMPITIPDVENPEINNQVLHEYYNSLENMLRKYAPNHFANKL